MPTKQRISYAEKLKDPRWQRKRLEILERDDFTCVRCAAKDKTLHVHHGAYLKGFEPWEHPSDTLWTLCEDCHEEVGDVMQDILLELGRLHPDLYDTLLYAICDMQISGDFTPSCMAALLRVAGIKTERVIAVDQG